MEDSQYNAMKERILEVLKEYKLTPTITKRLANVLAAEMEDFINYDYHDNQL